MSGLFLDEMAAYLAAQGRGTAGSTIFASMLPDDPPGVIALFESPGMAPSFQMGQLAPTIESPALQVRVRDDSYTAARDLCWSCYADLNAVVNTVLSGTLYHSIMAIGIPTLLERDQSRRTHFVANFNVVKSHS